MVRQPDARRHVAEHIDALALAPAFSRPDGWPFGPTPVAGASLSPADRAEALRVIASDGHAVVGQEVVPLSTMPVWRDGVLEPRPFTLRAYVVATPDGWEVMPGGFCRVSETQDPRALSMQLGGRSADVWVPSTRPVDLSVSLLPQPGAMPVRRIIGYLPSRAAENLFWLGRYLERAEATLRVVRCLAGLSVENAPGSGPGQEALARLVDLLSAWGASPAAERAGPVVAIVEAALHAPGQAGSVRMILQEVRRTASVIRDRLSPDAVRALAALAAPFEEAGGHPRGPGAALEAAEHALRIIAAFSGLAQENMNRLSGWRFLEIGRRIERGILTGRFVRRFAEKDAPPSCLDALLELTDSQITYRARYLMGAQALPVIDLVVLDDGNPRSVAFQVARLRDHLAGLSELPSHAALDLPQKIVLQLSTDLRVVDVAEVDADMVLAVENRLMDLSNEITQRFFAQLGAVEDPA